MNSEELKNEIIRLLFVYERLHGKIDAREALHESLIEFSILMIMRYGDNMAEASRRMGETRTAVHERIKLKGAYFTPEKQFKKCKLLDIPYIPRNASRDIDSIRKRLPHFAGS